MAIRANRNPKPVMGVAPFKLVDKTPLASAVINKGMVTSIDAGDLPNDALSVAKNVRIRYDKTSRRFGKSTYLGTKPNALAVKRLYSHILGDYSAFYIRVTNSGAHYYSSGAWVALTGSLSGSDGRIVDMASVLGTIVLANGVDKLQKVDVGAGTISDLGTVAPTARYVAGFADRVIAAATGVSDKSLAYVYWSGNRNIDEFDALEDTSAGNKEIATSSSGTVDPITGLFAFSTVGILPRQNSLWLFTKQPIASDPLNFYEAIPGVGADIPGAIALTKNGIIFFSYKHKMVYRFVPGADVEEIGIAVANEMVSGIDDPNGITSCYDPHNKEYHVAIPQSDDSYKIWTFNERTNAWSYDVVEDVASVNVVEVLSEYTSIDDLTGTIDALTGTIDDLSVTPISTPTLVVGQTDGTLLVEDSSVDEDNEVAYTMEVRSKEFNIPRVDTVVAEIRIGYNGVAAGTLTLQYSKDGGTTWTTAKTHTIVEADNQQLQYNKQIRCRRFMWRITSTDGLLDLIEYEVHIYEGGESRD